MFENTLRHVQIRYRCQLMRLMFRTIIPDDYHGLCTPYWIFERLDEIGPVLGITDDCYDNGLQRTSVAAILERIYTPFASYLINETRAYTEQRHSRYYANIYWYCLHKFLCAHEKEKERINEEKIKEFVCYVENFVEYLREKKLEYCERNQHSGYSENDEIDIFYELFPDTCEEADNKFFPSSDPYYLMGNRYPSNIRKYNREWFKEYPGRFW